MLIWKGSRRVPFLASHGLRWGSAPASNGTEGAWGTPLLQNGPQGPQGARAANVRAGAERHPVGWVPALPAGFLTGVKPRDVQWRIRGPELYRAQLTLKEPVQKKQKNSKHGEEGAGVLIARSSPSAEPCMAQ